MSGMCEDRVVIVTGAGRGIGREHALEFARQGAMVVVNDLGTGREGSGQSAEPAQAVVEEICGFGGEAIANHDDIAEWDGSRSLVAAAVEAFGRLDVLVNNAGFVRDRMLASIAEDEWDAVVRVHMKGHFCTMRHAAEHWRARSKDGERFHAAVVNTSSGAGLMGSVGQAAYSAAKAGIAALTLVAAAELGRYGVTVNAIAPAARTRMTEAVFGERMAAPASGFDHNDPANIAPLVAWLGSTEAREVTGRMFEVEGGLISLATGWQHGPSIDKGARWDPAEIGAAVHDLIAGAPEPVPVYGTQG